MLRCFTASVLKLKSSPAGRPFAVTRHVLEALQSAADAPFHLSEVAGIVVLDMAPTLPKWNNIFSPRSRGSRRSTSCSIQARSDWVPRCLPQ